MKANDGSTFKCVFVLVFVLVIFKCDNFYWHLKMIKPSVWPIDKTQYFQELSFYKKNSFLNHFLPIA